MHVAPSRLVLIALAWGGFASAGFATADEKPKAKSAEAKMQRVEGVIVQVKPFSIRATAGAKVEATTAKDLPVASQYRLTINTAVSWADYVRDQAVDPEKAKKSDSAKPKNQESVATEGQPASEQTEQLVDVTPATKIELRFRSSTDESDDGAATVAGAEAAQSDGDSGNHADAKYPDAKPKKLEAAGLRVGHYVIIEYHESTAQLPATKIIVLKPVGGADISAKDDEEAKPASRK